MNKLLFDTNNNFSDLIFPAKMAKKVRYEFFDAYPLCLRVRGNEFVEIIQFMNNGWVLVRYFSVESV